MEYSTIFDDVDLFVRLEIYPQDVNTFFKQKYADYYYKYSSAGQTQDIIYSLYVLHKHSITKMVDSLLLEYNVINNYDITETETGGNSNSTTTSNQGETTETGNTQNNNKISPFDSENFNNLESSENTMTNNTTSTISNTGNSNGEFNRTLNRKGNAGVTMTQQMIQSELELRKFNVVDYFLKIVSKYILLQIL